MSSARESASELLGLFDSVEERFGGNRAPLLIFASVLAAFAEFEGFISEEVLLDELSLGPFSFFASSYHNIASYHKIVIEKSGIKIKNKIYLFYEFSLKKRT